MSEVFSSRLRKARGKRSQAEICAAIGVKQGTYSTWELGKYEPPFEVLVKIAAHLQVSTDYLLGASPPGQNEEGLAKLESARAAIAAIRTALDGLEI